MDKPMSYGKYYWRVRTMTDKVWLYAGRVEVTPSGALIFWSDERDGGAFQVMAFGPGRWMDFHAASCVDGGPVAVEHWEAYAKGEKKASHTAKGSEVRHG